MATGIRINYIRIPAVCFFWMHIVLTSDGLETAITNYNHLE